MKREAAISRRQFLTGTFRGRDTGPAETRASSDMSRDFAQGKLVDHYCFAWDREPQAPDSGSGLDGVLAEMEDLKGIEDF